MTSEQTQEYDDDVVAVLELVWGEGFMSPGGPDEIKLIVEDTDVAGKRVLDIGCGTGGIAQYLAETFEPAEIVGIDVDAGLIERATKRASENGFSERLAFECVAPGPLPFPDGSFDVVFSKDSMIHIGDKDALFKEVFRVLCSGGRIAAGDWMCGSDEPFSEEMAYYVKTDGLGFNMASPARYRDAMAAAGFEDIRLTDRNAWYRQLVEKEHAALSGSLYQRLVELLGQEFADHEVEVWRALKVVVDSGELTWVCGAMIHKDAPHLDKAHDIIDSMLSVESGKWMIAENGYGHSNAKSFDQFDDAKLASLGLSRNPNDILGAGKFQIPQAEEFEKKMNKEYEKIKAGF